MFLKSPNKIQLQSVLNDCAKRNGTHILTTSDLVEYVGASGNNQHKQNIRTINFEKQAKGI